MRLKILFATFLLIGILANAQGRRKNQSTISGQYGYILDKDDLKGGFMVKGGYGRVFGDAGILGKAEGFYQKYDVKYLDNQILPYEKYGLNVSAGWSYEGLAPVMINFYGGVYGAFEKANGGNQNDPLYNAEIPVKVTGFTYGLTGSAELEILIVRRLSFVADYTQYYDLKSDFSKSNFAFFGGLKYYIN